MAKITLINPPGTFKIGSPLLTQLYLASSLLASGHEVQVLDLGAKYFSFNFDNLVKTLKKFQPDIVGFTIYTSSVRNTYDLLIKFRSMDDLNDFVYVAGGPHTSAVPVETIDHGFDIAVIGEGENTLVDIAKYIDDGCEIKDIKGIAYKTGAGIIKFSDDRPRLDDLDNLPIAVQSLPLFNPNWYSKSGTFKRAPANLLSSRGCLGKCIYCANQVTGRRVRYRSIDNIIEEMMIYNRKFGTTFFSFLDDSFTTNSERVRNICERFIEIQNTNRFKFQWSALSRADSLSKKLLNLMRRAGCVSINFGIESGSTEILERIGKEIDLDEVIKIINCCKETGLRTQVNFMLGFPWEGVEHLNDTLNYMKKIASLTDAFSTRGVLIPYPGTEIYDKYKEEYDFKSWWLSKKIFNITIPELSKTQVQFSNDLLKKIYCDDPVLDLDFFKYSPQIRKMIKKCLEFKGKITLEKLVSK